MRLWLQVRAPTSSYELRCSKTSSHELPRAPMSSDELRMSSEMSSEMSSDELR